MKGWSGPFEGIETKKCTHESFSSRALCFLFLPPPSPWNVRVIKPGGRLLVLSSTPAQQKELGTFILDVDVYRQFYQAWPADSAVFWKFPENTICVSVAILSFLAVLHHTRRTELVWWKWRESMVWQQTRICSISTIWIAMEKLDCPYCRYNNMVLIGCSISRIRYRGTRRASTSMSNPEVSVLPGTSETLIESCRGAN